MEPNIQASAPAEELLAIDAAQPYMRLAEHPTWRQALAGELSNARLRALVLALYPAVAGPGRYAFFAKVSQISAEDGAGLFKQLHDAQRLPEANADAGWRTLAHALDIDDAALDTAAAEPSPEAADLVAMVQEHGLRSSAAEAVAIAWAVERQLPALWGAFADSLVKHYGVNEAAVGYLRYEAGREAEIAAWIDGLVARYVHPADPYTVFEARRAAREVVWCWTALTESV